MSEPINIQLEHKDFPKNTTYKPIGCLYGNSTWYSCRDQFHSAVSIPKSFHFGHSDIGSLSVLIDWIERALHIACEKKTKLFLCENKMGYQGVKIEMSPFWTYEKMRFCFLTALCKSHTSVPRWKHPIELIFGAFYFRNVSFSTGKFLNGCTHFNGKFGANWLNSVGVDNQVKLVVPTNPKDLETFINGDPTPQLKPYEKTMIRKVVNSKSFSF